MWYSTKERGSHLIHLPCTCTKYVARHEADSKVLFFKKLLDLDLIDTLPPWYSSIKPQPVYETAEGQAYSDVVVCREFEELRANRVDVRIVNNQHKQVIALEMSCPWLSKRHKKTSDREDHEVHASQMGDEAEAPRI